LEWWVAVLGGAATGLLFKAVYLALEDIEVNLKDEKR
jgi:hypothetical protein